jgi:hypothetical protein
VAISDSPCYDVKELLTPVPRFYFTGGERTMGREGWEEKRREERGQERREEEGISSTRYTPPGAYIVLY